MRIKVGRLGGPRFAPIPRRRPGQSADHLPVPLKATETFDRTETGENSRTKNGVKRIQPTWDLEAIDRYPNNNHPLTPT